MVSISIPSIALYTKPGEDECLTQIGREGMMEAGLSRVRQPAEGTTGGGIDVFVSTNAGQSWTFVERGAPRESIADEYSPLPNPTVRITYRASGSAPLELAVYSLLGERVRVLEARLGAPGVQTTVWDGRDDSGRPASSGVYFVRLVQGSRVETTRITLLR